MGVFSTPHSKKWTQGKKFGLEASTIELAMIRRWKITFRLKLNVVVIARRVCAKYSTVLGEEQDVSVKW
jgi:hypothetical protein